MAQRLPARRPVLIVLGAILTLLPSAAPQGHVDVIPYGGLYLPLGSTLEPSGDSLQGVVPPIKHSTSFALGWRVTVWLPRHLGVEGSFGYTQSGVTGSDCIYPGCEDAYILRGSTRVVVPVAAIGSLTSLHVGGGVGIVAHGGRAYDNVGGTTTFGATVGVGVAVKVGALKLLRLDVEDYPFRPHLRAEPVCQRHGSLCWDLGGRAMKPGFQHDVVLSIGLAFRRGE